jgi:hypothetical protein
MRFRIRRLPSEPRISTTLILIARQQRLSLQVRPAIAFLPLCGIQIAVREDRTWPTAPFEHGRSRMMPIGDLERNADIGGVYGRS